MRALRARLIAQDNDLYINCHFTNYELKMTNGYLIMNNNVFLQNDA